MKNDMNIIMENWRRTTLLEGVTDLIKNKQLDPETIENIGDKLSKDPGFELAVELFSAMSEIDPEEMEDLGEGVMDWINSKIVQGMIAKDSLMDTLNSDSRFKPILELTGPALAIAFLYFKNETGGVDPDDYATAFEMITKKGQIGMENLADVVIAENIKKLRSPNG